MKVLNIEQGSDEWFEFRKGKISGSKLNSIVVKRGTSEKQGFYELLVERLTIDTEEEDPRDRGHRLEEIVLNKVSEIQGKKINTNAGVWVSDFSDNVIVSPDGASEDYTEAYEVKCLASWKHLQAILEDKFPSEYDFQVLQYFIVNEKLEKLYFCMYDDRLVEQFQLKIFEITREELAEDISTYKLYELDKIKKIEQILERIF